MQDQLGVRTYLRSDEGGRGIHSSLRKAYGSVEGVEREG